MQDIVSDDLRVDTHGGGLFARRWRLALQGRSDVAPIVLFHDSLGCVALWRDFPERLVRATGRPVIAYDRLGFGRSDPHPDSLHDDFIRDEARCAFRHVREQLGIGRFIAFGHSVGGGMAVGCAAEYPVECLAVVTESAQAFVEDRTIEGILEAKRAFEQPGAIDRLRRHHGDKAEWVLRAWTDTWLAPGFAGWSLDDDLPKVQCPSLVLHGDQDEFGSVLHPQRIAARMQGNTTVELLEGIGHVPHREEDERVAELIRAWLAKTTGT